MTLQKAALCFATKKDELSLTVLQVSKGRDGTVRIGMPSGFSPLTVGEEFIIPYSSGLDTVSLSMSAAGSYSEVAKENVNVSVVGPGSVQITIQDKTKSSYFEFWCTVI